MVVRKQTYKKWRVDFQGLYLGVIYIDIKYDYHMNIIRMNITVDITLDFSSWVFSVCCKVANFASISAHLVAWTAKHDRGLTVVCGSTTLTTRCSGRFSVPSLLQSFKLLSNLKLYVTMLVNTCLTDRHSSH